ncbi:MAG: hypothetical protein LBB61_02145 [Treponema sp.]|nr:hypothetical protein [Treponema sp.]
MEEREPARGSCYGGISGLVRLFPGGICLFLGMLFKEALKDNAETQKALEPPGKLPVFEETPDEIRRKVVADVVLQRTMCMSRRRRF